MKIKNIIVLIGPPGSGKGTQGKLLAPVLGYTYLSLGQYLREYSKGDSQRAKDIKKSIDKGHIIPDEWIKEIFHEKMKLLPKSEGVIFDGFPRDFHQIPILEEAIEKYSTQEVRAIFIDVPKVKILERLKERQKIESRADDVLSVIETRFQEYDQKTFPIVEYFEKKHKLITIHGDQSIEKVHEEILRKLPHA